MKKLRILIIVLILIIGSMFFSRTNAVSDAGETIQLKAQLARPFKSETEDNYPIYKYRVKGDSNTDVKYTVVKIYDIADKKSDTMSNIRSIANNIDEAIAYSKAFYCLRGGVGFGVQDSEINAVSSDMSDDPVSYTKIAEMHEEPKKVAQEIAKYSDKIRWTEEDLQDNELKVKFTIKVNDGTLSNQTKDYTINLYNAVLWILDEAYLPADNTNDEGEIVYDASEYRDELLDKAGIPESQREEITDNDIEVIQQLAIWYFTNYDEQDKEVNPTVSQSTMYPAQFLSIDSGNGDDNNVISTTRENNLNRLYQYLVYGAIQNADTYEIDAATRKRTKDIEENKFDKEKDLTITSVNSSNNIYDYYEIGPICIKNNVNTRAVNKLVPVTDIILYDADGNVIPKSVTIKAQDVNKTNIRHVVYKFLENDTDKEVTTLEKGKEYKIRIYKQFEEGTSTNKFFEKYNMSKFTLKVTSAYTLATATFYSHDNNSQPVVELEKEKISDEDTITTKESKELLLLLNVEIMT